MCLADHQKCAQQYNSHHGYTSAVSMTCIIYLFIYLFIRVFSMGTTTYRYSGYTFMKTILVHAEGPLATCASGLSMLQKLIT